MKLATILNAGVVKVGLVHSQDEFVFDLAASATRAGSTVAHFNSMLTLIDAGEAALDHARELIEKFLPEPELSLRIDPTTLLAPLPEPRQIRDGMAYADHIKQGFLGIRRLDAHMRGDHEAADNMQPLAELPAIYRRQPIYYITNRFSVRGPNFQVKWPRYSKVMDFELELGVVLGKRGSDISVAAAREHIFGYTIFNDFSARDTQILDMQGNLGPAKGKSFDGGNVIGPWIVTADELTDPYALSTSVRVNGEVWAEGNTGGMMHNFEEMIAYISADETLMPGEIIASGTISNHCGLEQGRFLKSGDVVELEVERIGVLRNSVITQSTP